MVGKRPPRSDDGGGKKRNVREEPRLGCVVGLSSFTLGPPDKREGSRVQSVAARASEPARSDEPRERSVAPGCGRASTASQTNQTKGRVDMSFEYLGVKPPECHHCDDARDESCAKANHYRGALLEAANHIETLSIWTKYISKAKAKNQLSEWLRISAGDGT